MIAELLDKRKNLLELKRIHSAQVEMYRTLASDVAGEPNRNAIKIINEQIDSINNEIKILCQKLNYERRKKNMA